MPRVARIVLPGQPHHITQCGNNRQDVFFVDDDRQVYLDFLQAHCELYGFTVLGYCLMSNHIHLVGTPTREDSLAKAIGRTHFRYSQYINRMHRRSGHLWQNRFFSLPWTRSTCGGRCPMWSVTRCGRRWYGWLGSTRGRVRLRMFSGRTRGDS